MAFLGTLGLAAYYDELNMSLGQIWLVVIVAPIIVWAIAFLWTTRAAPGARFDPTSADAPAIRSPIVDPTAFRAPAVSPEPVTAAASAVAQGTAVEPSPIDTTTPPPQPRQIEPATSQRFVPQTAARREEQARDVLVASLHELGDLAPAVEHLEGADLLEVLEYLDSLRLSLTESNQILQGVVRGFEAEESP